LPLAGPSLKHVHLMRQQFSLRQRASIAIMALIPLLGILMM